MDFATLIGIVGAFVVFGASIVTTLSEYMIFLDPKSLLMVVGGTTVASLICFPIKSIFDLFKVSLKRLLGKNLPDYQGIITDMANLSAASRKGPKAFEQAIGSVSHPFIQDGAQILQWLEAEISQEELRDLLETRAETHFQLYSSEAKIFKTMSKFPPAFGLMGTTLGLVALLQSLGSEAAKNNIGPAMAVALITTLWGLALSNFILVPISENLSKQTQEDMMIRRMIIEGIMLIADEKPTKYVEEKVKSFLLPSQREEKAA